MYKRTAFLKASIKTLIVLLTVASISEVMFIRTTQAISIFTVTNTNDVGSGSLRQAILNANASPGFDIINFAIPGTGVKTILPLTPLPRITDQIFIDGWSQGGQTYSGPPLIEISGINVSTPGVPGLRIGCIFEGCESGNISVDFSTLRGLTVNGFPGNTAHGIVMFGSNNSIRGCYIGTTANGEAALPNGGSGIRLREGFDNVIGGTIDSSRNIVSGNLGDGITIFNSNNNRIQGNYVGLSASGLIDVGNGGSGIAIGGADNLVGGSSAGMRNVISGNSFDGITMFNPLAFMPLINDNRIEGNYIGTKPDGVSGGVGNDRWGIHHAVQGANQTVIGGSFASSGNVISGNGSGRTEGGGIRIFQSVGNRVQSNLIGVGADRVTQLGNLGDAISIESSGENRIGGALTFSGFTFASGNLIAFNQGTGVRIAGSFSIENRISHNLIHSNSALGIDLEPLAATANDLCDADTGPNQLQNFPVITSVTPAPGGGITIAGRVNGPLSNYRIEVFNNNTCDPSGNGEGEQFLGSTSATSAQFAFCRAFFAVTFPNITIGEAKFITATATDPAGNTSEFSACFDVH